MDYYISTLTSIDLTILPKRIAIHFHSLLTYLTYSTKPNVRVEDDRLYFYLFSLIYSYFHSIFFIRNLGLEFSMILYNIEKNVEDSKTITLYSMNNICWSYI